MEWNEYALLDDNFKTKLIDINGRIYKTPDEESVKIRVFFSLKIFFCNDLQLM